MTTESDGMILIEGILVDVRALLRLKHYCDPMLCRNGRYCCAQYEITVDKADIKRAVGLMPDAANGQLLIRRPVLPSWLENVYLRGLRIGAVTVDLQFMQTNGVTTARVLSKAGGPLKVLIEC